MNCYTYEITSPSLKPFIQFILFNSSKESFPDSSVTYYPNNDICLGIIHKKQLVCTANQFTLSDSNKEINSYLTGFYSSPHKLCVAGSFDEICLPFTPLGYYHFFRFSLKEYILEEDVLSEAFGASSLPFFESVFEERNIQRRGQLIELYLQRKLINFDDPFLKMALHYFHESKGAISLKELTAKLNCSEKKLQRVFSQKLDVMPKEYAQILKFREALHLLGANNSDTLTDVCYEAGYYDQSHFIRNITRFTGKNPGQLKKIIKHIDQKVLVSFA
jgi:AraC-like DNA-binding protein